MTKKIFAVLLVLLASEVTLVAAAFAQAAQSVNGGFGYTRFHMPSEDGNAASFHHQAVTTFGVSVTVVDDSKPQPAPEPAVSEGQLQPHLK